MKNYTKTLLNFSHFIQGDERSSTPWILVVASSPNFAASMVVRGPLPLNIVQLLPKVQPLDEFSTLLNAAVSKADELTKIHYPTTVAESLHRKGYLIS